jgi:hypothetical protein
MMVQQCLIFPLILAVYLWVLLDLTYSCKHQPPPGFNLPALEEMMKQSQQLVAAQEASKISFLSADFMRVMALTQGLPMLTNDAA